jgi:hypothetical protein
MKTIEQLEIESLQNALIANDFRISDAAKSLGLGTATMYRKIAQYRLATTYKPTPEFKEDPKGDLVKALKLVEDLMEYCDHCADFSNGNVANGVDEGNVLASNAFYRIKEQVQLLKNRNNL